MSTDEFTELELNEFPIRNQNTINKNQHIVIIDDSAIDGDDDIDTNEPPTMVVDPRNSLKVEAKQQHHHPSIPRHTPRKIKSHSSRSCCLSGFTLLQETATKSQLISNNFPHLGSENVKLRFLSYNLFIRPPGIMNNSNDYKDERLTEFIREMVHFDIIGLQEVFSSFSSRQYLFIKKAYSLGFYYYIRSPKPYRNWSLVDGGLLLLSKYPIEEKDYTTFTLAMQSDALSAKGVLYAKIQITSHQDASVHVFLTHTQAAYANSDMARNTLVRKSQLIELRDFILKKTSNDNYPVVVLGDLNVNARKSPDSGEDSEEYLGMMDVFRSIGDKYVVRDLLKEKFSYHPVTFADTWIESGKMFPRETQLTDHSELCTMQRLDYVMYFEPRVQNLEHRFAVESSRVMPFFVEKRAFTQISDHYGVESVFEYQYRANGSGSSPLNRN